MTNQPAERPVAEVLAPVFESLLGGSPPIRFRFWDDSTLEPDHADVDGREIRMTSPDALRRIMWAPGELGLARAFVVGDVEVDGPVAEVLRSLQTSVAGDIRITPSVLPKLVGTVKDLGILGKPLPAPPEELVPRGLRHSMRRDKQAVSHHYDVGNDFYRIVLGPAMTYSCGRFVTPDATLEEAQASKHDLICRKLGLADEPTTELGDRQRRRMLDVGCGWGSMAIHAATHYDVDVVGVTISEAQADRARKRVSEAGLADQVEIRIQDYREVTDGPFDVISSIGMAEHVGLKNMVTYFGDMYELLAPGGRMMNHAIGSRGGSKMGRGSFVGRYVFPDGELLDLADTVRSMEAVGFEVRDVENLREHYARTLTQWVANLEADWDAAVELVGARRARVWQLYMSGSINGFVDGGLQLYQTLGVKWVGNGTSNMPRTRANWN